MQQVLGDILYAMNTRSAIPLRGYVVCNAVEYTFKGSAYVGSQSPCGAKRFATYYKSEDGDDFFALVAIPLRG